ncbi:MAG: DUF934 domain-containing protein [Myxococcales bacterium]|jgi:uncharacterized protein (DUF934 family)
MGLIKNGKVVQDDWTDVADDAPLPEGGVIVSLARLQNERETLAAREGKLGVRLPSDALPDDIAGDLPALSLVAIEFPKYVDGRGYSVARLLRERHGFGGELRAVGNVLRDQLFYMSRCGFDAYELQPGKDEQDALDAFREFSVTYQAAADDSRPLYRRR